MSNNPFENRRFSTLMLLVVAVIWGAGFIGTQIAIDEGFSTALILTVRFSVGALLIGIGLRKSLKRIDKRAVRWGVWTGTLLFLSFFVQTFALKFTTPANNAFLTATYVVMVPIICWIIYKVRPKPSIMLSALLCLIGVGILSLNVGKGFSFSIGDILTLVCALIFALHTVMLSSSLRYVDAGAMVFLQLFVAAVLSLLTLVITERDYTALKSVAGLSAAVYLGVFSTGVAYFLQTMAQRFTPPTIAAIVLAAESLFGSLFSVLLGYEPPSAKLFIGGAVITASIILSEIWPDKRETKGESSPF